MDFSSVRERNPLDAEIAPPGGTPLYLAPEVFQGAQPTRKTDIYALGVLLYRLVSGRYPVEAERLDDLTGKHARGSSVPLRDVCPDLPPAFVHTVERALEQDPIHRYASVGEMERDLVASLGLTHKPQAEKEDVPIWRRSWFQGLVGTAFVMGLYAVLNQVLLPNEFHVQASLFRSSRGTEERLLEGATVSPGDDLFLEIEGSERMYVYVLNEDERGNAFVLFPLPDVVPQNPLASDASYRLPGRLDGVDSYWEVSTSGGTETLLVVASWQRLVDVERFIQTLDLAGQSGPIVSQPNAPQPRRGIGGLSGPNGKLERSVLSVIHDELGARNRKDGLWVWQFQLKNRGE
jgi:serine/threonine protein kinase